MAFSKQKRRLKIRKRIRKTISGDATRPRLSVYRSNKSVYAQLIDDVSGKTLASVSSFHLGKEAEGLTKVEQSKLVGKTLAEKALKLGVEKVSFDRGGYLYHGRVKSLAEGAREGGLKF
ncbi:50S ribosomal protein L18 [Psychroflexus planctonicus]|uniref:Large ribosomal subunit protein uL18 n=1 Tax=Psychroflexus planctonicus TaxID=1526575 RepID=A0ABQ1SBA0_9FLAO|nr:50S ribosomal protein L18 [Psychroflexus planctonicus]GGE23826.1 50S ribosomal protein L18 [Psychroflexus planctonicus]